MSYERPGAGPIDYHQCRYGRSKLLFRGPKRNIKGDYFAFVGGSEVYGKYVQTPFVDLLQDKLDTPCVNFGAINAGVDAFVRDSSVLDICGKAKTTVVQVLGAQNMSNRFYSVHPRRNDRFLKASSLLRTVYSEIDFTEFAFTRHLLSTLQLISSQKFDAVVVELQEAWVGRMTSLLRDIPGRKVLLWIAGNAPPKSWFATQNSLGDDPLFVTQDMIDRVAENAQEVVEIILPHACRPGRVEGMLYPVMDVEAAREMLGPAAHNHIAHELGKVLS